jgi:hypothetical protein
MTVGQSWASSMKKKYRRRLSHRAKAATSLVAEKVVGAGMTSCPVSLTGGVARRVSGLLIWRADWPWGMGAEEAAGTVWVPSWGLGKAPIAGFAACHVE